MGFLRIDASSRVKEGLHRKRGLRARASRPPLDYAPANYPQALLKLSLS